VPSMGAHSKDSKKKVKRFFFS